MTRRSRLGAGRRAVDELLQRLDYWPWRRGQHNRRARHIGDMRKVVDRMIGRGRMITGTSASVERLVMPMV